jgi:hypothetical protein
MIKKTGEKRAESLKQKAIERDLGCIEGDAVPARGGRLRLGLLEEGDGGVVELCEFQRLPPPLTQENPDISFIWGTIKIKVGRNRAIIWGTKISKKGISPKNQKNP